MAKYDKLTKAIEQKKEEMNEPTIATIQRNQIADSELSLGEAMYLWPDGTMRPEKAPDSTENNGIYTCSSGSYDSEQPNLERQKQIVESAEYLSPEARRDALREIEESEAKLRRSFQNIQTQPIDNAEFYL